MGDPIRVGVIGTGYGQHVHVPAFQSDTRCRVSAICARSEERAREVSLRCGIPRAFGDWREMVAAPDLDALAIALPPALQVPIVLAAARAGKHVFCEKPAAPTAEQARAMLSAVQEAGVVHAIDFLFPEVPAWRKACEVLNSRMLGALRSVHLSWRVETYAHRTRSDSWKLHAEQGGGTLNNFVSHSLYYLEWLFGPIAKMTARLDHASKTGDARVDAWFEFPGGVPCSLSVAADAFLGTGHRLEVYGDDGTLILENRSSDYVSGFQLSIASRSNGTLGPIATETGGDSTSDGRRAATASIVARFIDAIESGRDVTPSLVDGLRVQELLEAARAADRDGGWRTF